MTEVTDKELTALKEIINARFDSFESKFDVHIDKLENRIDSVESKFDARIDSVDNKLEIMTERIERLEKNGDKIINAAIIAFLSLVIAALTKWVLIGTTF